MSLPFGELTRPTLDEGHQQLAQIGTYALPACWDVPPILPVMR